MDKADVPSHEDNLIAEATLDGFVGCLSMVHQHIRELRAQFSERSAEADLLDRLNNRIAEDTK